MSGSSEKPWSDNPRAPQIPYEVYIAERGNFVGDFIAAMLYGCIVILFFQCTTALLAPVNHVRGNIRWVLVAHTTSMFLIITLAIAMGLDLQSISHIDNREFPGAENGIPPGPLGYKQFIRNTAISIVPNGIFQLNQWLADGLLLYRCCLIYSLNYRAIAIPCLMYFTSFVTGIMYWVWGLKTRNGITVPGLEVLYFPIALSLNILLTFMIAIRLILHYRRLRQAMGVTTRANRLYKAIPVLLVESCTLYSITFLPYIFVFVFHSSDKGIFWPIINGTQVLGPLLIVRQVVNRSSVTSDPGSEYIGSLRFRGQQESTDSSWDIPTSDAMSSTDTNGEAPRGHVVEVENAIEEVSSSSETSR